MTVARRFGIVSSALAVAAVGWAAPASAILPPADGIYSYAEEGAPATLWQVQTVCIQPNGTRIPSDFTDETIQSEGCTVVLRSYTPQAPMTREEEQYSFAQRARLTNGMWTFQTVMPQGLACPDGSTAPTTDTFAFAPPDPNAPNPSVTGLHTRIQGAECGLEPAMAKTPFTLNFSAPLDPPVGRYPAMCDYLVGRRSICS
jgi:hypothetical protein